MNRHHAPHSYKVGDKIIVRSGINLRDEYPGVVDRVTSTRVHVTYDASSTGGMKILRKVFYGATGCEVGGFKVLARCLQDGGTHETRDPDPAV